MVDNTPFLKLDHPCDEAVEWLASQASLAGLSVVRTFDLQAAHHDQAVCLFPHHGTDKCDCQMVVLMVYQVNRTPVTIVVQGYNNQTWFSIVDTPEQRADPRLETSIRHLAASLLWLK
jgi:hypothetical protein